MKKKELILCLSLSIGAITGCQQAATLPTQHQEAAQETQKREQPTKEEKTKNQFLQEVKIGMTEEQIRALFGTQFALVQNTMEGNETWRFDLGTSSDYQFQDQGIDQVDMEGLKSRKVKQQLFIDWNENGLVQSAALYTVEQKDLFEYHLLPDGTREEKKNPS